MQISTGNSDNNRLSLYIHIPFCAKKCRYCDFYSVPYDPESAVHYLTNLEREIAFCRQDGLIGDTTTLSTIFIGGGTPSLLAVPELGRLCGIIRQSFRMDPDCEWTVECNPESFTDEKARTLSAAGVNRLTFGFQSLDSRELQTLGRIHSADRCLKLLANPVLDRFASVGIDLIYGIPGQTVSSLKASLVPILGCLRVNHISAYELTMAENTPFGRHRRLLPLPVDDDMARITESLWSLLHDSGFEQYEVSNFARNGFRCRHNEAYWDHQPYLGLGCAAHSFVQGKRFGNVRNIVAYREMIRAGNLPREYCEVIDVPKLSEEMIFLGLRRTRGIDLDLFKEKCGVSLLHSEKKQKIAEFVDRGLLQLDPPFLRPSGKGLLMADGMALELI